MLNDAEDVDDFGMIFIQHSWIHCTLGMEREGVQLCVSTNEKSTTQEFLLALKFENPKKAPNPKRHKRPEHRTKTSGSTTQVVNQRNEFVRIIEPTETHNFVSPHTRLLVEASLRQHMCLDTMPATFQAYLESFGAPLSFIKLDQEIYALTFQLGVKIGL